MDLNLFEQAESTFKYAINLATASSLDLPQALGYFNLGICYERQGMLQQSLDSLQNVLSIELKKATQNTVHENKVHVSTRVLFQLDKIAEGLEAYNELQMLANELADNAYIAKLNVIHSIYVTGVETQLDAVLNILKSYNIWFDATELSIKSARFYKKKDNHKLEFK
ncbi:aspartate phosphatase [Bacillus safensis]|uniref:aspartate phosphatase n=1 Tax=Bacillus safensis TaxID=561879 RepID=UPI00382F32AE